MLEFLDHPHKSLRSHTNIILVKTTSLVNNGRLAASYLDNVYVRETPSLGSNVSQRFERGVMFHVPHPHGHEILSPTCPRRERDPQRVHHNHRQSSRCSSVRSPTTDQSPWVDSFHTCVCILPPPSSTSCSGVIVVA